MRFIHAVMLLAIAGTLSGCATGPEIKYATEAERVKSQALEPVMLSSAKLEEQLKGKYASSLPTITSEQLIDVIQKEVANTKRFTQVLVNMSEGSIFVIQPQIDRIDFSESPISYDPNRKKVFVKSKVSAVIYFQDQAGRYDNVKTFEDERKMEKTIPVQEDLSPAKKQEFYRRTIETAFRALADQIGNEFNPSYEMGTISRIDGRIAYVQINTSAFISMKKNQQAVDVIDDDNNILATIQELKIADGSLSGKFFEKSGKSIKSGMKVRARVKSFN